MKRKVPWLKISFLLFLFVSMSLVKLKTIFDSLFKHPTSINIPLVLKSSDRVAKLLLVNFALQSSCCDILRGDKKNNLVSQKKKKSSTRTPVMEVCQLQGTLMISLHVGFKPTDYRVKMGEA